MTNHDVVIAGGGPTGLMLAGELALAKVDVAIVERRENQDLAGSRAGGFHARTLEVLDQRGIAERFVSEGKPMQIASFGMAPLDISDFPTRHNYGLALWQNRIERLLADWVAELGVKTYRGADVTDFGQDAEGVEIAISNDRLRGKYLVGCDGGRSLVRKAANIEFEGWDASISYLIAEARMHEAPESSHRRDAIGTYAIGKIEDGKVRIVLRDAVVTSGEPTLDDLRAALVGLYGTDYGLYEATWLSRFSDATRQAAAYRSGRVLLAGDAAHIHSPMGGQGLNLGVQDAVNLGWKLAQVVKGISNESLLDSYRAERHPVAKRALRMTMAQTALSRADERITAVVETIGELMKMDEPRRRYAGMISGLDIHYDLGEGHPLLGRRMPDLELDVFTAEGPRRVFSFLHAARPLFLNFGTPIAVPPHVQAIAARYEGAWELPVIRNVTAPSAVLVRPDGYVAWVGEGTDAGLRDAITKWFGD